MPDAVPFFSLLGGGLSLVLLTVALVVFFDSEILAIFSGIVGAILLLTLIAWPINAGANAASKNNCHRWGIENTRLVKWAQYTFWDGDCLTPDGKGHWISTSQLYVNIPKGN